MRSLSPGSVQVTVQTSPVHRATNDFYASWSAQQHQTPTLLHQPPSLLHQPPASLRRLESSTRSVVSDSESSVCPERLEAKKGEAMQRLLGHLPGAALELAPSEGSAATAGQLSPQPSAHDSPHGRGSGRPASSFHVPPALQTEGLLPEGERNITSPQVRRLVEVYEPPPRGGEDSPALGGGRRRLQPSGVAPAPTLAFAPRTSAATEESMVSIGAPLPPRQHARSRIQDPPGDEDPQEVHLEDVAMTQSQVVSSRPVPANSKPIPEVYVRMIKQIDSIGWDHMNWDNDYTLLHWASKNNRADLCQNFIAKGADPKHKDQHGKDAFGYAKAHGSDDALAQLRRPRAEQREVPIFIEPAQAPRQLQPAAGGIATGSRKSMAVGMQPPSAGMQPPRIGLHPPT